MVQSVGECTARFYGAYCGKVQCIDAAEVFAAVQAIRNCFPPLAIHTDSGFLAKGWLHGREWCTAARRAHADVWTQFWDAAEDVGLEHISVVKVKRHATVADVLAGRSSPFDKWGNQLADAEARKGAKVHPCDQQILQSVRAGDFAAKITARWIARGLVHASRAGALPAKVAQKDKRERLPEPQAAKPEDVENEEAAVANLESQRVMSQVHASHSPWSLGSLVFCMRCGVYAERRARNIARPCRTAVIAASRTQFERLRAGRHPASGELLGTPRPCVARGLFSDPRAPGHVRGFLR